MTERGRKERRISPRGPTLVVGETEGPPIDLEAWAARYVKRVIKSVRSEPEEDPGER